jgi:hypothetical protein
VIYFCLATGLYDGTAITCVPAFPSPSSGFSKSCTFVRSSGSEHGFLATTCCNPAKLTQFPCCAYQHISVVLRSGNRHYHSIMHLGLTQAHSHVPEDLLVQDQVGDDSDLPPVPVSANPQRPNCIIALHPAHP